MIDHIDFGFLVGYREGCYGEAIAMQLCLIALREDAVNPDRSWPTVESQIYRQQERLRCLAMSMDHEVYE